MTAGNFRLVLKGSLVEFWTLGARMGSLKCNCTFELRLHLQIAIAAKAWQRGGGLAGLVVVGLRSRAPSLAEVPHPTKKGRPGPSPKSALVVRTTTELTEAHAGILRQCPYCQKNPATTKLPVFGFK